MLAEALLHLVELERLDDGFDFFHGVFLSWEFVTSVPDATALPNPSLTLPCRGSVTSDEQEGADSPLVTRHSSLVTSCPQGRGLLFIVFGGAQLMTAPRIEGASTASCPAEPGQRALSSARFNVSTLTPGSPMPKAGRSVCSSMSFSTPHAAHREQSPPAGLAAWRCPD